MTSDLTKPTALLQLISVKLPEGKCHVSVYQSGKDVILRVQPVIEDNGLSLHGQVVGEVIVGFVMHDDEAGIHRMGRFTATAR